MEVERRNRTSGSLPRGTFQRDEHRRPAELLDDPRRHDADDPWVPALLGEHYPVRFVEIRGGEDLARADERGAIDLLPPLVHLLEVARERICSMLVFREEQLDAADGMTESPDGVQPRSQNEADAPGRDRAIGESRGANQRSQPD